MFSLLLFMVHGSAIVLVRNFSRWYNRVHVNHLDTMSNTFESHFFLSFMTAQVRFPERLQPLSHCMKNGFGDQFPIT